jgi:valyl-tRNA synthetase
MYGDDEKAKGIAYNVLNKVLTVSLQLLHPVMPFITEEIYTHLYNRETESITISKWPKYDESLKDEKAEKDMDYIIEAIKSVRNIRTDMNVPFSRKAKLIVYVTENQALDAFKNGEEYFQKLASASEVEILEDKNNLPENAVSAVTTGAELFIPLLDLVDKDKELARLEKEKEKLISEIERVDKKLKNEKFVSKAPEAVVEGERAKGEKYKEMLESVLERINSLK